MPKQIVTTLTDSAILFDGVPTLGSSGPVVALGGIIPAALAIEIAPSADATLTNPLVGAQPIGHIIAAGTSDPVILSQITPHLSNQLGTVYLRADTPAIAPLPAYDFGFVNLFLHPSLCTPTNVNSGSSYVLNFVRFTVTQELLASGSLRLTLFWKE